MTRRASSLNVLQFCAQSSRFDLGAGRAAAMSTAFHAKSAGEPDAREKLARLTTEETEEILSWKPPAQFTMFDGRIFEYGASVREDAIACDAQGNPVDFDDPAAALTGHPDMYWIVELPGRKVVVVGDIKKTRWTTLDGPDSLQLIAYALILAAKHGCDAYICGLWIAEEGYWIWGDEHDTADIDAMLLQSRILSAAANNSTEYARGPHCRDCYGRLHCPAYMVHEEGLQSIPGKPGETELDEAEALKLLGEAQRYETISDAIKDHLKEWARRNGGIRDGNGKVWRPVKMTSGESAKIKPEELRELIGEKAKTFIRGGAPFEQFRWVKA